MSHLRALASSFVLFALAGMLPANAGGRLPAQFSAPQSLPAETSNHDEYGPLGEVWRVPMRRREIALTFDDGPYPFYTPLLLHVLDRSHVNATFFIVGRSAQEFPELLQRIVASGDEVGNHTFNHYRLTNLSVKAVEYQIAASGRLLTDLTGAPVTLFRPPHGRYDHRVAEIAHELGYRTIFWNDSPQDVKEISPALEVQRVVGSATPGGIVLLHSGQYRTIVSLPLIIDRLRAQGYRFVTVGRLLKDGASPPGN